MGRLIDDGWTNAEIGEKLGISERTAKSHSDMLRIKLGVAKRREIGRALRAYLEEENIPL